VNVIVETPRGSRSKFKFDHTSGLFKLHKLLPVGAAFPFDFGFIPRTVGDDGDPLDLMLLDDVPVFTGCLVTARLLGVIEAKQTDKGRSIRNDRLLGMAETQKIRPSARTIRDIPARLLDQLEHFFVAYNELEGRRFQPLGRRGPRVAAALIDAGIRRWTKEREPTA
jgi:inorganic pyrophosphatase